MAPLDIGIKPNRPSVAPLPSSTLGADFVAIDFETANRGRASACAIGVAVVKGGIVVDQGSSLINPEAEFEWYNKALHGIGPDDVRDAPRFNELWPQLVDLLQNQVVVAHGLTFDLAVLRKSVARYELPGVEMQAMCSWRLAKLTWTQLPAYKLSYLCHELGLDLDPHEAGSDALASAEIVLAAIKEVGATGLSDWCSRTGFHFVPLRPGSFMGLSGGSSEANATADPDHPLHGLVISLTGTMFSMTRDEAKEAIAAVGATWKNYPSKNVDMLVIGDADFVSFADGNRTEKMTKAVNLREKGHHIEIMAERDFLALL